MGNKNRQSNLYEPGMMLSYHQDLTEKMREYYDLPDLYHLVMCSCRKDAQLFSMATSLEKWEQFKNAFARIASVQQYTQLMMEMSWKYLQPQIEDYYGAKIKFWHLLGPYVDGEEIYTYSVKFFETPLFRSIGTSNGNEEDKLASMISGYIRDMNSRGPERVTVAIIDPRHITVSVSGLVPRYIKEYVTENGEASRPVENMMASLINGAVDYAFQSEYQFAPEKLTEVDFKNDHIVTLAIVKAN